MANLSKPQRMCIGVFVLLLVDVIWVSSSELTEYLFKNEGYRKPFFNTYVKTSLFMMYLLGFVFWRPWRDQCQRKVTYTFIDPNIDEADAAHEDSPMSDSHFMPIRFHDGGDKSSGTESDESSASRHLNRSVRFSRVTEVRQLSESEAEAAVMSRLSYSASLRAQEEAHRLANKLSVIQVANVAAMFCFLWFAGNFSYQEALANTEAGVVNVLSSTSGLFTLILASILPATNSDKFSLSKFFSVLISMAGVVMVSISDLSFEQHIPTGAIWAVLGALFYAMYLVFLRRKVDSEEKMDIPMFFGFVGLFNFLMLWPGLLILHFVGIEKLEWPNSRQWTFIVVNGIIGTVFSELLWLWGCFLTSSLVATLSISLTIPMTMVADILMKRVTYSYLFFLGTLPMFASFFATSLLTHYETWDPVLEGLQHLFKMVCRRHRISRIADSDREQTESLIGINSNEDHDA